MKVGDLVKYKGEDVHDPETPKGIVVEVKNPHRSVTYEVWVSWNFLDGEVGRNFSYQLEVINESR